MQCKPTSNIKLITTKRPTLQNSKKQITYLSYSQKWIIKEVKFHLQNFDGFARILSKKYYQTKITQNWHQQDASASAMRMRQFAPHEPPADIPVKPQEYKSDPEVSLNHGDIYARAWEYLL